MIQLRYTHHKLPIYNNPDLSKVDNSIFGSFGAEIPITGGCMPCGELKCNWGYNYESELALKLIWMSRDDTRTDLEKPMY